MTHRPIIFSATMVRALLEGRKTQTRRILNRPAVLDALAVFGPAFLLLPGNADLVRFAPGDRLWVREAHSIHSTHGQARADGMRWGPWGGLPAAISPDGTQIAYFREGFDRSDPARWRPSIHMPRWASRLTLVVTDVRVQRLQEIEPDDCHAEGVRCDMSMWTFIDHFRDLWNRLHGGDAWAANPWVAAVTFTVHRCNIDAMEAQAA